MRRFGYIRQMFSILTAVCLMLASAVPVMAADDEYTYTVRIYAGKQGTIGGSDVMVYDGLRYGERVTFNQNRVALNNGSKYYVRGLKQSGRDNDTSVATASFLVTQDVDYVVSYGLLGSSVAYTVNYVDASGNALADSETYYGNVGDRPVVAFLYIEGYQPQAYNLTATLKENALENIFTFVYTRIQAPAGNDTQSGGTGTGGTTAGGAGTGGTTTGTGGTGTGSTTAGTGGTGTGGTAAGGAGTGGTTGGGTAAGGNADGTGETDTLDGENADNQDETDPTQTEEEGTEEPQEILDLDGNVPLAGNPGLEDSTDNMENTGSVNPDDIVKKVPAAAKVGIFAGILVVAAGVGYLIWKKRKKKRMEE